MLTLLCIFVVLLLIFWFVGLLWSISPYRPFKKFYHDILGWCEPDGKGKTFDGCSIHARCRFCGKDIMQDSQGNWF